jgi:hypothetical protein
MLKMGVIKEQQDATPISNTMVIIKKRGKLRTCIDLTDLRWHFQLSTTVRDSDENYWFKILHIA